MKPAALFLFHLNPTMAQPWADAGYDCYLVDMQHPKGEHRDGNIIRVGADIHRWVPPTRRYLFGFSCPPCTDVAVSGARWFVGKGLYALADSIAMFARSVDILEAADCPYGQENPVSTISSYWRKPDEVFQPYEFTGYCIADNYTKKTCLWTGGGFQMPDRNMHPKVFEAIRFVREMTGRKVLLPKAKAMARFPTSELIRDWYPDNRIHLAAPGDDRANERSATPLGFSFATFQANHQRMEAAA